MESMEQVVWQSTSLTNLNLERNELRAEGAKHVAEGLKVNQALTYLNISKQYFIINDEGQVFQYIAREFEIEPS